MSKEPSKSDQSTKSGPPGRLPRIRIPKFGGQFSSSPKTFGTSLSKKHDPTLVDRNRFLWEFLVGIGRVGLIFGTFIAYFLIGLSTVPPEIPLQSWLIPVPILIKITYMLRFFLLGLGTVIFLLIAAGGLVQEVYVLPRFQTGLDYVFISLFGLDYPLLVVDKGQMQIPEDRSNLVAAIGGPGAVNIYPRNVVAFRSLTQPTSISAEKMFFLKSFEMVGEIANLEEQYDSPPERTTMTRDGIQVKLRDVHYRFKIKDPPQSDEPRSLDNPYPFDEGAVYRMAYGRSVDANGLNSWRSAVQKTIMTALVDYINGNKIDILTAPRQDLPSPRGNLSDALFESMRRPLDNVGTVLTWMDIGHLDIIRPEVDDSRLNQWAADWMGNAASIRAYAEAKRIAYQELGRSEAQAELIMGIVSALKDVEMNENTVQNLQMLLLTRTAQIVDVIRDNPTSQKDQKPNG